MGRTGCGPREGQGLGEHVTLGVLARFVPADVVDAVLRDTGRVAWRARQLLPRVMVYYVMALTLYAHASYDAVLRELVEGLRWLHWDGTALGLACKSAITQARVRLGEAPMRELFRRLARPLAEPGTPGAWYRGRRLRARSRGVASPPADLPRQMIDDAQGNLPIVLQEPAMGAQHAQLERKAAPVVVAAAAADLDQVGERGV